MHPYCPLSWCCTYSMGPHEGERITGVTTMYVDEALDEGDIILQSEVPILSSDTMGSLHDKLSSAGAELLLETVEKISSGTAPEHLNPKKEPPCPL